MTLVQYAVLVAPWVVLLVLRSRSVNWIGDFWIYVASIHELAAHPFDPGNPLYGEAYPFAFHTPYLWALAVASRVLGLAALDMLVVQGALNLALLLVALHLFLVNWMPRRGAAPYAFLLVLFLWGPDPWIFSGFFHLRSLGLVLPYPSTFASALALLTLGLWPVLSRAGHRAWTLAIVPVTAVLLIVHPLNALFLWLGIGCWSVSRRDSWRWWLWLGAAVVLSTLIALAWPLLPLRQLWFEQIGVVHAGNDTVYREPLRRIAPALVAAPWLALRLWRNRLDPVSWLALVLAAGYAYGGLTGQWSFGRLLAHAVLVLQLAGADALGALEDRLRRGTLKRWAGVALALGSSVLLVGPTWGTAVQPSLMELGEGDADWLACLRGRVTRTDIVLSDPETNWYIPSFSGRVVAYPMRLPFVPDYEERVRAVRAFFEGEAEADRFAVLERYGVDFVLLDKTRSRWEPILRQLRGRGDVVFTSERFVLVKIRGS